MNAQGLTKWCERRKLKLMRATTKRKQDEFNRNQRNLRYHRAKDRTFFNILICTDCNIFWNRNVLAAKKYDEHSFADLGWEWTATYFLSSIKTKRHIERGCFSPSGERFKNITG
jgi:hypothetical protein